MAEIPVEHHKKGGLPWWIPLLLLLLLIPILFFLFRGCNTAPVANVNTNGNTNRIVNTTNANNVGATTNVNTGVNSGNANTPTISVDNKGTAAGARITDLAALTGDRNSFVGRGADLKGVKVTRVLSDRVFTVTAGSGEMFMMLDDKLNAGGKEQQIRIKQGQTLNLAGEFRNVPTGEVKDEAQNRDLNAKEYAQMKGQQVYLHVNSVSDAK